MSIASAAIFSRVTLRFTIASVSTALLANSLAVTAFSAICVAVITSLPISRAVIVFSSNLVPVKVLSVIWVPLSSVTLTQLVPSC